LANLPKISELPKQLILQVLTWALAACASWYALMFIYVALYSIDFPFSIEWMEGHVMATIQQVANGKPVYQEPSLEYVPFIYTPLYYYVCAALGKFTEIDFWSARLVSISATLGIAAVFYCWLKEQGGSHLHGIIAAGLYFACYDLSSRWYDLARVDSLFVFSLVLSFYIFFCYQSRVAATICGLSVAAAFFTKQSALIACLPLLIAGVMYKREFSIFALATALLSIGIGCFALNAYSDGWFAFYTFEIPAGHPADQRLVEGFWHNDIMHFIMLMIAYGWLIFLQRKSKSNDSLFSAAMLLGCIAASYLSRIHWGGHVNVLMPMFAGFAYAGAIALKNVAEINKLHGIGVALLLAVQFYQLQYDPNRMIPDDMLRENNEAALKELGNLPGEIFASDLQFVQERVGKKSYNYGMAGFDVLRIRNATSQPSAVKLGKELEDMKRSGRFVLIPGIFTRFDDAADYGYQPSRLKRNIIYPVGLVHGVNPNIWIPKNSQ
jgi:hypothetical protein